MSQPSIIGFTIMRFRAFREMPMSARADALRRDIASAARYFATADYLFPRGARS